MARRAVLGGGSLSPFGGGGVDFGAFNVLNAGNEAYLTFVKVETAWNAGHATNDDYLAALKVYADAQDPSSSDYVSAQARLVQAKYQVGRNVLLSKIDARTATTSDLLTYDKTALDGLTPDSEEYQQRLGLYRQTQSKLVSDEEQKQVDLYQAGKITTTQLQAWYKSVLTGPVIDNNPDLVDSITGRVTELVSRVQDEKDSKMLSDYNDGKVTTHDFLAYATAAKARYGAGTQQAQEWDGRIKDATTNASETALLYRYNLSQQYEQLAEFVKGNSGKGAGGSSGGTSTSHQTRVILGADGQWHSVTTTTTKATPGHGPTPAEQASYAKLQIQLADAKKQMAQIAAKVSGVGGFVSSATTLKFYTTKLGTLAKGSSEWYAVQGKIDNLNDRMHQEAVTAKEGIKITYPSSGTGGASSSGGASTQVASGGGSKASAPKAAAAGGGGYNLGQFMRAIATQESGGRYDARNASTGAYGKYQILPSNWASWAQKAGLPANAPQTPENQEKVAAAAFGRLAKSYNNDWSRVAAAWFAGVAGSANPDAWGPRTVRYVDAIMSHMGTTRAAVSGVVAAGGGGAGTSPHAAAPASASGTKAGAAHSSGPSTSTGSGPLSVITSVDVAGRKTSTEVVSTHNMGFPTNLDGRAFEKFYANYENAFQSGAESFVDTSSGKAVAYFIGSDPGDRIDRMRQLDDLRVKLFDTRAIAYQGTPSEITAVNARNNAYKDVARHEYLIVDTASQGPTGSKVLNAKTNPLAAGIRVLDATQAAIKSNIAMAEAAYKRGDVTTAYHMFQEAQALLNANGSQMQLIATYAGAAQAKIAAITKASGGITPDAALGGDAATFATDLSRLEGFDKELTGMFDATASTTLADMKSHLDLNPDGSVKFDNPGDPRAQLVLTPDTYFALTGNGDVKIESRPPTYDGNTGQMGFADDKTVTVKVKVGSHVLDAQATYAIGQVGSFVDPNDPTHLLPIMGKVVQQKIDGKWTSFYENPMAPGTAQGWSATPFTFNTPSNFTSVPDGKGGAVYQFQAGGGYTYSFVFDPKTGTYQISANRPGGIFNSEVKDQFVGSAGDAQFGGLVTSAGFVRAGTSAGFDATDQPIFGFSDATDYQTWKQSFQPPAVANLGKVSSGGLSLEDRDAAGMSPAQVQARRVLLGINQTTDAERAQQAAATGAGNNAVANAYAARAKAQSGHDLAIGNASAASALANRAKAEAAMARVALPTAGATGLPAATQAAMAARAQLPTAPDPEWVAEQRRVTAPSVAASRTVGPSKKSTTPASVAPPKKTTSTARRPLPKVAPPKTAGSGLASKAF